MSGNPVEVQAMAELWQSYGSWILYGLFFLVMVLLHGRMHGHGGHGRQATGDHTTHSAQAGAEAGHAHGDPGKPPTRPRRGCC